MQTPLGPSLQLILSLADVFAELSVRGLTAAWERWIGPQRFERKLAQFARVGWLEDVHGTASTERIIRLTAAGRRAALGGRDPEACWRRPWDGRWRLVLFDVPETQRALRQRLRQKLRALGFGYLQNSAWISPDPVEALKDAIGTVNVDVETLSFLEARPGGGETDAQLVLGAWDFRRINRDYEVYGDILQSAPTRVSSRRAWRNWFDVEWRAWCRAVRSDPLLPEALLPQGYRGRDVWQRRTARLRGLLQPG
ncbi:MAG: PaaX family transcriptional regulator C-terminal domain-containing protein [Opitutaceae bacterium]|nr:PaaX family transcriptional regulator C-terminal domain-containing protein [Opitutaceae bacterium]